MEEIQLMARFAVVASQSDTVKFETEGYSL
jgi:hypothetical protein